jgi:hypothetical protein
MPKVRDILVHAKVETAGHKRNCHRKSQHSIPMGCSCLVITDGPYNSGKNYCPVCAEEMLSSASQKLDQIRSALGLEAN